MICVSVGNIGYRELNDLLQSEELAEIRLDLNDFTDKELKKIFSSPAKTIVTCRPGKFTETERIRKLMLCMAAGASYIDIEMETAEESLNDIISTAGKQNCKLIISHHNFEKTPPVSELKETFMSCSEMGADIVKIACQVKSDEDNAILISLYHHEGGGEMPPMIIIGLGKKGRVTRIAAPFLGAPFTYASFQAGRETGDGQINKSSIEKIIKLITDG